jgi:hypothetical protein
MRNERHLVTAIFDGVEYPLAWCGIQFNDVTSGWQSDYGNSITVTEHPLDPTFQSRTLAALIRQSANR